MTVSDQPVYICALLPYETHRDLCQLVERLGVSQDELVTAALETFLASEYVREQMEATP